MLNLDNFYKKDDNYIEVIDYTKKGISKKAIYHDGDSKEKIYVLLKNFQPYENAYFYNGLAVIRLGKIQNLKNWGAFKNVIPTNSFCVVDKKLDVIATEEELDSEGFAIKPSSVLKLVKKYGIGALQILKPEMLLIKDFETTLYDYFEFYLQNKEKTTDFKLKKDLKNEKIKFYDIIFDLKKQLIKEDEFSPNL